jgi:hypothetical protein
VTAAAGAAAGVFSRGGPGPHDYLSVRGRVVTLWGRGLYQQMSADVEPQGIAQDWITLLVAVPALLLTLRWARRGSLAGRVLLAGTLAYFFVTYLFYLMMAMYNGLFLVYAALLASSFFALALALLELDPRRIERRLAGHDALINAAGGFLLLTTTSIALLWLGIVVPPLLRASPIPDEVAHYTTLVVQGLDLGLLLPLGFVAGALLLRRRRLGYLLAPVYLAFLVLLMTALTAKVVAMGRLGTPVLPAIVLIPAFGVGALALVVGLVRCFAGTATAGAGRAGGDDSLFLGLPRFY